MEGARPGAPADPDDGGPEDVAEQMAEAMREAARRRGSSRGRWLESASGSPGDVERAHGDRSQARNLPGWEGEFKLGAWLRESLGAPVRVGNDVQVATEAEFHLGAGRPYQSMVGVFWGTGVGGGIILDGKPWLGRGAAGEIGHIVVKSGGAGAPAGGAGASRPTRVEPRWRPGRGGSTRTAARPSCSRS